VMFILIMLTCHFPQGRTAIFQYDLERQYGAISVRDTEDIKSDVPAGDYAGTAMKREDGRREVIYFKMYDVDKSRSFPIGGCRPKELCMDGLLCLPRFVSRGSRQGGARLTTARSVTGSCAKLCRPRY
jgi:hypothetical protein